MEVISNSYMPGDLRLVEQLVSELKSQGIFDQFRKECIADVDTKPAYQNLRQRVEGTVTTFLKQQTWNVELNKNQLREHLRKNLYESGFLETGVERIVDQVVNPKISTVFLPKVEEVVYKFLGVEKPNNRIKKEDKKVSITDLLPTDLEAVSPESSECSFKHEKKPDNQNDSLNSSGKMEEDESPAFEPLGNIANAENDPQDEDKMQLDENSHSSEISGSQNNEGLQKTEMRNSLIDSSNQDSQNSTETRLSIVTSEDTTKMEICEDSSTDNKNDGKFEEVKSTENVFSFKDFKKDESMVNKSSERTSESDKKDKRSKSSDKYKDKKDDRHRKSSSSRDRDKYSRHSSYKSSKDRDSYKKDSRDKDRSKERNDKERDKSKYDREKSKSGKDKKSDRKESAAKDEKDQEKYKQEKSKSEKEKSNKDKFKSDKDKYGRGNEKDSKNKEKSDRDKEKCAKDKHKEKDNDNKEIRDKNRTSSSSNNGSNSSKHTVTKDKKKDSNHNSDKKEKHNKDIDSKSKSTEKKKKDETNKHNSNKKEAKDPKKKSKDDHYSSKIKKNDRRSTDRDSNDGASSKNNDTESLSSRSESNSQEHSNSSFSGSGDSGNSDQAELTNKAPLETNAEKDNLNKIHPVKYLKPKFASNLNEAMRIMKIRKQLARLEKQNQLSLSTIDLSNKNGSECSSTNRLLLKEILIDNQVNKMKELGKEVLINNVNIMENSPEMMEQPVKRANLSMENFEALEAKLAQVMSNVNYNSYESDEDYEYTSNNPNLNKDKDNKNNDDDLEKKDSCISPNNTLPSTKNNHVVISNQLSSLEYKDECLYLEKPSAYEEKNLKFLKNIISQFEEERDGSRGKKRKLDENIVFKSNIEMQYTDIVHNRRDSNSSNKVVSKANKKRMCNNTDITPVEHFSLPLSPAESDKSGDRKEEDLLIPTKQKRIIRGYSQRYSSEDLYKPRPVIGRRNKFPRHVDN